MGCGGIRTKHPLLSKDSIINMIIWAGEEEDSRELIDKLLPSKQGDRDIWTHKEANVVLNGFIRAPKLVSKETPRGMTDVLMVYLSYMHEDAYTTCKSYVDSRSDIPFKYVIGDSDMEKLAKALGAKLISKEDFAKPAFRAEIVDNAAKLDFNLKTVFCDFDLNQNMSISADELFKVSKKLSSPITLEEATQIAKAIDPAKGNIEYEKFKFWWLVKDSGLKLDKFRNSVRKQISVDKFAKGSDALNNYMQKMKSDNSKNEGTQIKINIQSENLNSNDVGSKLSATLLIGEQAKNELSNLPEIMQNSPFSFNLVFPVIGDVVKAKERLDKFKLQFMKDSSQLESLMEMGLVIDINIKDKALSLDFYFNSQADEVSALINGLNLRQLSVQADGRLELSSEVKFPADLMAGDLNLTSFVKKALNGNLILDFNSSKFGKFLEAFKFFMQSIGGGYLDRGTRSMFEMASLLQVVTNFGNEVKFSPESLIKFYKMKTGEVWEDEDTAFEELNNAFVKGVKGYLQFMSSANEDQEAKKIIREYLDAFTLLNLNDVSCCLAVPAHYLIFKAQLQLNELTESLNELMK